MASLATLSGPAPHRLLAELRAESPVAWIDELDGWLVTSRAAVLEAMRDADRFTVDDARFTTARVVGPSMLSLDGAEHRRHRTPFVAPLRRADVHERLGAVVESETARLLDAIAPTGRGDLRAALAGPLAAAVVAHALGLDHTDTRDVLRWYAAIVDSVQRMTAGEPLPTTGRGAFAELRAAIEPALHGDPSASLLAAAVGGHALEPDEAASNAAVLLFGGIETTEGMIATAIWHLLGHPEALARVTADPALIPAALDESLRLEPAAAMVDRYAVADTELAGTQIAAGDLVALSLTAANRDPAVFADPDRFDIERAGGGRHLAFAAGPHVCIGVHLARLEAHTALTGVLSGLPGLACVDPVACAPRGLVFRKPPQLEATWRPAS